MSQQKHSKELPRPKMMTPQPGDSEYERGLKDGMWQQLQIQHLLTKALSPTCLLHIRHTSSDTCLRCGEIVGKDEDHLIKPEKKP